MPAAGETLAGRFLLGRVLRSGESGVVFEARDLRPGRLGTVKVFHPGRIDAQSLEGIRREVHAARGGPGLRPGPPRTPAPAQPPQTSVVSVATSRANASMAARAVSPPERLSTTR